MNKILILCCLFCASACSLCTQPHIYELNKTISASESNLKQVYNLRNFGAGGELAGNIKEVYRSYTIRNGRYTIDEARTMIVTCTEEFYHRLNESKELASYLNRRPFGRQYIVLSIIFCDANGYFFEDGLVRVGTGNNKIWYSTNEKQLGFIDLFEEPYEVAYEKVYGHKICD